MEKSLSSQRLKKYINPSDAGMEPAFERYAWNIKLSQSLYPCLSLAEITLRNHLDMGFSKKFGNDWLLNGSVLLRYQEEQVKKAKDNLAEYKKAVTKPNIIAELTFGFWTALFSEAYRKQKIYQDGKIIKEAFPKIPSHFRSAEELSRICVGIRDLRNRVFHHEPIFNIRDLVQKAQDIKNILEWTNEKIAALNASLSNFDDIYWNQAHASDRHYAIMDFQLARRADMVHFLAQEISAILGKSQDDVRFQCDAIIKHALHNKSTIRLGIHKNQIIGLLIIGKSSVETLVVTSDWKKSGMYKWFLDFSQERYPSGLFIYTFDSEYELEKEILDRSGKQHGTVNHPELKNPQKKFQL